MKTKQKTLIAMLVFVLCVALLAVLPLAVGAAEGEVAITAENFPDEAFRTYVSENFDSDKNGALSAAEIAAVTEINVERKEISDLTGIKYFTSLTTLNCAYNSLKSLDVSGLTSLTGLNCIKNSIESLDISSCTALTGLSCQYNSLTSLDVSSCTSLLELACSDNALASLDVSALTSLKYLMCGYNNSLTSLDVSGLTSLTSLYCDGSSLTSLDVSGCTALTMLRCDNNAFTSLDVSTLTSLETLNCQNNSLTSLDVSTLTSLKKLYCQNNALTSLDVSALTSLKELTCQNNALTSLDVSNNTLLNYLNIASQAADIVIEQATMSYTMPAGFDSTKVTSVTGGDFNGDVLIVDEGAETVTYTYDTGKADKPLEVTLTVTNPHTHTYGEVANNDFLKTPADCTNGAVYYKSCECGKAGTETFTYGAPVHSFNAADVCTLCGAIKISEITFPDEAFRYYIQMDYDTDGDGFFSAEELAAVTRIEYGLNEYVYDLTGIEYFTELTVLYCTNMRLEKLDLSKNTKLVELDFSNNRLTSLDLSNNTQITEIWGVGMQYVTITIDQKTMSYDMGEGFDGTRAY